jgi:hypothetical protein
MSGFLSIPIDFRDDSPTSRGSQVAKASLEVAGMAAQILATNVRHQSVISGVGIRIDSNFGHVVTVFIRHPEDFDTASRAVLAFMNTPERKPTDAGSYDFRGVRIQILQRRLRPLAFAS